MMPMRKTIAFTSVVGALLVGFAVPAGAATPAVPSFYSSWFSCEAALTAVAAATGAHDYFCMSTVGNDVPGPWVLVEGPQGG